MTCAIVLTYACLHYRVSKNHHIWICHLPCICLARPLRITIYRYDMCLVYVCAYTPRSGFNIVYSCVHTLSHDYSTALTIYGYVCAHTPRKDFNMVYIHYHMTIHYHVSIHWVIANERAVLTSHDSQQPIRDHAPTWRRMGVYFTLYILLTQNGILEYLQISIFKLIFKNWYKEWYISTISDI